MLLSTIESSISSSEYGIEGSRFSTIYTYDDDGSLLSTLSLRDGGGDNDYLDGAIDSRRQTLYENESNYVPTVVNSIADIIVDDDAENQTIDLSDVFEPFLTIATLN